ncbi:MAG: DNA recombination protein RmuC [Patescibacteria group bacterium]
MEALLIGIAVLAVLVNVVVLFAGLTRKSEKTGGEGLSLIQQQLGELTRTLDARVAESSREVNEAVRSQFSESARLIKDVTQGLTKLDETNRQVVSFADQLQHLQNILQNPKQRGVLGEYFLESVLQDVLPEGAYERQYAFGNGEIVDAVVKINKQFVPIDAKFSLENYNRMAQQTDSTERQRLEKLFVNDLKMRIKETSKYIRPEEGTTEFAFMFIPSEGIYYDLLSNKVGADQESNLLQRAYTEYKVIIVSPTTFLAYLQTVIQGLRSLKIEEQAKDIQKRVGELGKHLGSYDDYMKKLGSTLQTTVNHYTAAYKEFGKIDKDILRISGESAGVTPMALQGPERD